MSGDGQMKRKPFSEEQIIGILKEAEAGTVVTDLSAVGANGTDLRL